MSKEEGKKSKKVRPYIDVNVPIKWEPYFLELLKDPKIQAQLQVAHIKDSKSGLGVLIIREFLLKIPKFRFYHVNTEDKHITIQDEKMGCVADVYVREQGKLWCEYCDSLDCDHVSYALTLPEVKKALKKKGFDVEN